MPLLSKPAFKPLFQSSSTLPWSQTKNDNPGSWVLLIIGTSAIAFAAKSINRTFSEMNEIERMWTKQTTIKDLMEMQAAGKDLPEMVLVKGIIGSDGPPVRSICSRVEALVPLLGQIDQKENLMMNLGNQVASGELTLEGIDSESLQEEEFELSRTDLCNQSHKSFVVSDLLITRLSCWAYKKKETGLPAKYVRHPRHARSLVHHSRSQSQGLHLRDSNSDIAELRLPQYNISNSAEEAPDLFLTVPDAQAEFNSQFRQFYILNPPTAFTHLSKFISIDQRSKSDDGNTFGNGFGALDEIGHISPHNWLWTPKAYYDNNKSLRSWAQWPKTELIPYSVLKQRIKIAAKLNNQNQNIIPEGFDLAANRDTENCFRITELGIPDGEEVTVMASPRVIDEKMTFVSPDRTSSEEEKIGNFVAPNIGKSKYAPPLYHQMQPRYRFKILQGHSIANLRQHKRLSLLVYAGLGAMGFFTAMKGSKYLKQNRRVYKSA